MGDLLGFSLGSVAVPLLVAALLATAALVVLGLRRPYLARVGLRNVPRRRMRTGLIVFGLMLATMFVASALAVDDTITLAVKNVAVFNLGRVDEVVSGGGGGLSVFPMFVGRRVSRSLAQDPHVAGVAPALVVPDLLLADVTVRQVRGGVTGLGLTGDHTGPLGDLRTPNGAPAPTSALAAGEVYLNRTAADLLRARAGDTIYVYSTLWPGQRFRVQVRAIVTGGPLGDAPVFVAPLAELQAWTGSLDSINRVFIANSGDGLSGVRYSDEVADRISWAWRGGLTVTTVKQDGVRFALTAQNIFGRILALFTLFALAVGLLLIFLIFTLLAAERRAELGMARAMGMRRGHLVGMLLLEGVAYDSFATALGLLVGLGLGTAVVALAGPVVARMGFPLRFVVSPESLITAFCLGYLFTLGTIALASWTIGRMTVAAALRDLPEPPAARPSLRAQWRAALLATPSILRAPAAAFAAWGTALWGLVERGLVVLLVGGALLALAVRGYDALTFSLGLSVAVIGLVLVARWLALAAIAAVARRLPISVARATRLVDRLSALVVGGALALYWALPFDALAGLGLPRFTGGVPVLFAASVMMVFGTVWAIAPNLDVVLAPLRWLGGRLARLGHVTTIALVYPAQQRFRAGVGLSLFSLVCFTTVVLACIAASTTQSYDNVPAQTAGYDIVGQPLFTPVGGVHEVQSKLLRTAPSEAAALSAVSSATPLPLGIIQPDAPNAGWRLYPVSEIQGAFLDGVGLPLVARAEGFSSDAAVWSAVRNRPGSVVVDVGALSGNDVAALGVQAPPQFTLSQLVGPPIDAGLPGLSSVEALNGGTSIVSGQPATLEDVAGLADDPNALRDFILRLRGIVTSTRAIAPTTLWVADLRGGSATKLTVVGLVDNAHGQRYGLFGSPETFAPVEFGLPAFGNQFFYFQVKAGANAQAEAQAIGSALLDEGFETTVLQDTYLDFNGPRVFISRVLVGLVALMLLVGMAALAVSGSRAVVERRQQIGMLRALGFHRLHVQVVFLIEALLVGVVGTALGVGLGLVLSRNAFAVNFFAQYQSGLVLVVPWGELAALCAAALAASLLAALLPAWQAGRVAPADALRYE